MRDLRTALDQTQRETLSRRYEATSFQSGKKLITSLGAEVR
jgi:hypothetical protein